MPSVGPSWWCCCDKGCIIFEDNFDWAPEWYIRDFDRTWDTDNATGEWWVGPSPRGDHLFDGALLEVSGDGELWLKGSWPGEKGSGVSYTTIDELPGTVCRILLCGDADMSDCLIAEYGQNYSGAWITLLKREGGVETTIKSHSVDPLIVDLRGGHRFSTYYTVEDGVFCASIQGVIQHGYCCVTALGVDWVGSGRMGVANKSGSDYEGPIPLAIDDLYYYRLYRTPEDTNPCFNCICRCSETDEYGELTTWRLFPSTMYVRMTGTCCTHTPGPQCDGFYDCYGDIDFKVAINWVDDIHEQLEALGTVPDAPPDEGWLAIFELCDVTAAFIWRCVNFMYDRAEFEVWWLVGGVWSHIVPDKLTQDCTPIVITYHYDQVTPSGMLCCDTCMVGGFDFEVTET